MGEQHGSANVADILTISHILPHLTERGQVEVDAAILRLQLTELAQQNAMLNAQLQPSESPPPGAVPFALADDPPD